MFILHLFGRRTLCHSIKNHFADTDVNENILNTCKVLVNCTPIGMFPKTEISVDIPFHALSKEHLVIDLIYNPEKLFS